MGNKVVYEVELKGTGKAEVEVNKLTQGVKKLNKELKDNRGATQALDTLTGGAATKVQNFQKQIVGSFTAVKNLTKGMKLLKVALLSSGIGAIAVLVGALAANWEKITGFLKGASFESQKLAKVTAEIAENEQKKLDSLNGQENILKLQGKSEEEILRLKAEQTKQTITALEASITAQEEVKRQQEETAARGQKILSGILKFVSAPLTLILGAYDKITGSNTLKVFDDAASLVFDPEKATEEANEQIEKTKQNLDRLKNTYAGYQLSLNKIDADEKKKRQDKIDKEAEEERKRIEEENKRKLDEENKYLEEKTKLEDEYFNSKLSKEQQEINAVRDKYFSLIQQAEQYGEDASILEAAQSEAIAAIKKEYADAEAEEAEKRRKEQLDKEQELEQKKMKLRNEAFDNAVKLAGEESKLGKAILVAKTLLAAKEQMLEIKKTYTKAQTAVKDASVDAAKSGTAISQGVAETGKIGFPQNIPMLLAYAAQAVGVVAAIKSAVSKTKAVASSVGAGGGGGAEIQAPQVQASAPAFNVVGASGTNQLAEAIAGQQQQPIKAFVVSNDVSTAQELDRNIVSGASIG